MNEYVRPSFSMFPPVVKNLLIINVLCFITTFVLQKTQNIDLTNILGLHYFQSDKFHFFQIFTYMFMHGGIMHIALNMFGLWMFGNAIENYWGSRRFLIFYLICGVGAAFTQEAVQYFYFQHIKQAIELYTSSPNPADLEILFTRYFSQWKDVPNILSNLSTGLFWELYHVLTDVPTVGASGAIYGILLAFAVYFPNTELFIMFVPIPIKAKYAIILFGAWELYSGVANRTGDDVAHYAHLGGMLFGLILILYWKKNYWNGKRIN